MKSKIENKVVSILEMETAKTEEVRKPDLPDPGKGKAWRRKYDGLVFYGTVYIGMRFYSTTGKLLKNPIAETVDDYEIIDAPKTEEWL